MSFLNSISSPHAYLDPGSGSLIFQIILVALLGIGIAIRVFWNKIRGWFGTKPKTDQTVSKPISTVSAPIQTINHPEVQNKLSEANSLGQSGKPQEAMIMILKILEKEPANSSALELAARVLISGGESISKTISQDPLLDSLYAQCAKCGNSWLVDPLYKAFSGRMFITNPAGGKCLKCGKIYCRNCAGHSGIGLTCPDGHSTLDPISEPNGRKRKIAARSSPKKLAQVAILRHAPDVLRPAGYIQLILESSCSEAFTDNAGISYQLQDKAPEQMDILAFLSIKGTINGWPNYLDTDKFDISYNTLTDSDSGKCTLVTVYYK